MVSSDLEIGTDSPQKSDGAFSSTSTFSTSTDGSGVSSTSTSSTSTDGSGVSSTSTFSTFTNESEGAVSSTSTFSTSTEGSTSSGDSFLDTFGAPSASVTTEPMIDVYSIRVFKKSFEDDREEKCQVYGTIRVVDLETNVQCLLYNYKRGSEHPDVISFDHCNLTLNRTRNVFAMEQPIIIFDIWDKATDAPIIKGRACLNNATTAVFEEDHRLDFEGEGVGRAYVYYTALRFGVAAFLELTLLKSGFDSDEESVDVCGSILVCHSKAYCSCKSVNRIQSTKFFKTQASESQVVEFGSPIKLARRFVAVPAYSSLIIEFNLKDPKTGEAIFVGQTTIETKNHTTTIDVPGKSCRSYKMTAEVRWKRSFMLHKSSYDKSLVLGDSCAKLGNGMVIDVHPMLEVFSVFIGRENCEELSLYGKIVLSNLGHSCTVFDRTEENPCRLPSGCNALLLDGPSCTMTPDAHFCIYMELTDVKGRIHIKGSAHLSYGLRKRHKSWHDRWLCSIFKGAQENGFAALNYKLMPYAVKSVVKVKFLSKGRRVFQDGFHGKIVAFYDVYKYKTDDDREYHRSVLFKRSKDECFMPKRDNTEVELSRSVVPVQMDSSLLIQVQLKSGRDRVGKILRFEPWGDEAPLFIQGGGFDIGVSVEWCYDCCSYRHF